MFSGCLSGLIQLFQGFAGELGDVFVFLLGGGAVVPASGGSQILLGALAVVVQRAEDVLRFRIAFFGHFADFAEGGGGAAAFQIFAGGFHGGAVGVHFGFAARCGLYGGSGQQQRGGHRGGQGFHRGASVGGKRRIVIQIVGTAQKRVKMRPFFQPIFQAAPDFAMFHSIEKYRSLVQVLLGLITASFVIGLGFTGAEFAGGRNYIVKIGDQTVTRRDLEEALRNTAQAGGNPDRNRVFQTLVEQAYLEEAGRRLGIGISDEQIKQMVVDAPEFQGADKKFSPELFRQAIQAAGLSEEQFVGQMRRRMTVLTLISLLSPDGYADAQIKQTLDALAGVRVVRSAAIDPQSFAEKIPADDAALKKYYEANKKNYILPQAVKFQYFKITPKLLADKQSAAEDEIRQAFDARKGSLKTKYRIAHILFAVPADAPAEARAKARAEAEAVAGQAKADPSKFAELAKQHSQDGGSKDQGGIIGDFAQGEEIGGSKPLSDAAFALKKGGVSGVVESSFGYHILYAADVLAPDYESQKELIAQEIKEKKAQQDVGKLREEAEELAVEHSGSLKEAAAKAGVPLENEERWLTRANAGELGVPEAVVKALFDSEVFEKKHNSEGISANGAVWFVRATATRTEAPEPFDQVKERVKTDYVRSESLRLADEKAKAVLAELQAGKNPVLGWSLPEDALPADMQGKLTPDAYRSFIRTIPKNGRPAYVLLDMPAGPVLMEVQSLKTAGDKPEEIQAVRQIMTQRGSDQILRGYIDTLRSQLPTEQGNEKIQDEQPQ